jgi:membrane-associated protease RseP (regulator of RpoE activity)
MSSPWHPYAASPNGNGVGRVLDERVPPIAYPPPKFRDRVWLHAALFGLTILTTTLVGANHYAGFLSDFLATRTLPLSRTELVFGGFWYSATILAILGAHELGHYIACRFYNVDASLPFFLPAPVLTGTLGAFIRIREPIPSKRILFDIGVAGPFAGFAVALPALLIGLSLSRVVPIPPDFTGLSLGEPLLFRGASWLLWGTAPDGYSLNLHPMAFAAWFGLLATALNLIPIGQLDGGHISYAVLGRRSTIVTKASVASALVLTYFSRSWLVWTGLMVVMIAVYGADHPPLRDEDVALDRGRVWLALLALAVLILCFTPAPIEPLELLRNK